MCYNCNKPGHLAPFCPEPNKRKLQKESETPPKSVAPGQSATQMLIAAAHHDAESSDDDLDYGHDFSFHILGTPIKNESIMKAQEVILTQHGMFNKH